MANCKDCLGFEFCLDRLGTTKYYDNAIAANNVEELCQKFKDRNRFIEVVRCKDCEKKKMTNLEKVRKMGIFELADFLSNGVGCPRDKCIAKCDCIKCFVEWLKSEVEE